MIWRGVAAVALLVWFAGGAPSLAGPKRIWVDPPPDLIPAAPPPALPVEPPAGGDVEATGAFEVPLPVLVTSPVSSPVASTQASGSCTVRTYVVLSGATVRVVGC